MNLTHRRWILAQALKLIRSEMGREAARRYLRFLKVRGQSH